MILYGLSKACRFVVAILFVSISNFSSAEEYGPPYFLAVPLGMSESATTFATIQDALSAWDAKTSGDDLFNHKYVPCTYAVEALGNSSQLVVRLPIYGNCVYGGSSGVIFGTQKQAICPVEPLRPITDPIALQHESGKYAGKPDTEHLNPAAQAGLACILQKVAATGGRALLTSGFRPPQYQAHLYEVYSKWQLLKDNKDPACSEIKEAV